MQRRDRAQGAIDGPVSVGVIGSGNQARTQLECLASVYQLGEVAVYSPTATHREHYAREMSRLLGITVTAADNIEAAVRGKQVVASASGARTTEPILRGEWLDECRLLCAVGNTRKQFCEVDIACFRNASLVVVDTLHALEEAGELRQAVAAGALPESKRATLGQIVTGAAQVPAGGLIVFKSVGSALQDLALASRYYELLGATTRFGRVQAMSGGCASPDGHAKVAIESNASQFFIGNQDATQEISIRRADAAGWRGLQRSRAIRVAPRQSRRNCRSHRRQRHQRRQCAADAKSVSGTEARCPTPVLVNNKPGGNQSLAVVYLNQHASDAHYLLYATATIFTNQIAGITPLAYTDFTPLALLLVDYSVITVAANSPMKSMRDMVERLRADPESISFGVVARGGPNHLAAAQAMRSAGIDPKKLKMVVFKTNAESLTAVMGGHIQAVVSSVSAALPQVQAGNARMLAVTAPQRVGGSIAQVPTMREQGIDAMGISNWRGIIGAKSISAAQIAFWEEAIGKTTATDDWKKQLDTNNLASRFMRSREFAKYLEVEYNATKVAMTDTGLIK